MGRSAARNWSSRFWVDEIGPCGAKTNPTVGPLGYGFWVMWIAIAETWETPNFIIEGRH